MPAEWVEVKAISEISQKSFPLIKCLGDFQSLQKIQAKLSDIDTATTSLILDSVDPLLPILLVTHNEVNKGIIFKKIYNMFGWTCPIIAAGDDNNDIPLLQIADIGIAMKTGSKELQLHADILATSSLDRAIIPALEEAKLRLNP